MDQDIVSTELTLEYKTPVVVADNTLLVTKHGQYELAFLQFNQINKPIADVVAAVRFQNVDALRDLMRAIQEHLDKEEKKEP